MIHYCVNMDGLEEIEAALGKAKDKSKYVLRAAINDSAKEVQKRLMKEAGQRYARNEGGMKPYRPITKVQKATIGKMAAIVEAKDGSSDLYEYKMNDRTYYPGSKGAPKAGAKAKQLKSSRIASLALRKGAKGDQYKAFVVKYHSGHLAIAQRVPGTSMKGKPEKEAIRSLYGTSKPKAEEIVFKKSIDPEMYDLLMRNIQCEIKRFME